MTALDHMTNMTDVYASDEWQAALAAAHEAAAQVWQALPLPFDIFAAHLVVCLGRGWPSSTEPSEESPAKRLAKLHTDDLYLACAAGHGVGAGTVTLIRHFHGAISGAVHAVRKDPGFLGEVSQALHERLLIATSEPPRILQYGGRAALGTWLGVAAQRLALELIRAEGAHQRATARASEEPLPIELDPELVYLKTRYRDAFKEAVTLAIGRLPQRHRTVLRLHTVGGLTLLKIAAMFEVDESTASRWLQRAREDILHETQRELGQRLGVRVTEVPSIARMVTSQIDVSVARLLGEETPR
jgi:RNA polymerase sigma-70 factor (ECF subfamily)